MSVYKDLIKKARSAEPGEVVEKNGHILDEIIEDSEHTVSRNSYPVTVPLTKIRLPSEQPRKYFDPQKMSELVASVKEQGILEPLIVRPLEDGAYELVAGERRLRASQELNLSEVPITVKELTQTQAQKIALIENLQREDLNPVEEVEAILKLVSIELGAETEENLSSKDVASLLYRMQNEAKGKVTHSVMGSLKGEMIEALFQSLGVSWRSFVSNKLPVLKWPEDVLEEARSGKIAFENAKIIARIKDPDKRSVLLNQAISDKLSISEIKERLKTLQDPMDNSQVLASAQREVHSLTKSLGKITTIPLAKLDTKDLEQLRAVAQQALSSIDDILTNSHSG